MSYHKRCNGTIKKDYIRCKCKGKILSFNRLEYCGKHISNVKLCPICKKNKISIYGILNCWKCNEIKIKKNLKRRYEEIEELKYSENINADIISIIFKYTNSNTKYQLRKLCKYIYNNIVPTKLVCKKSKSIFKYKSSMSKLKEFYTQEINPYIINYLYNMPNLIKLDMSRYIIKQKFIDILPISLQYLNTIIKNVNIDKLSNLIEVGILSKRKIFNNITIEGASDDIILNCNKLEMVVTEISIKLPKSVKHIRYTCQNYKVDISNLKNSNIEKIENINISNNLNFLPSTLNFFSGFVPSLFQISKCNKLESLNIRCDNYNDTKQYTFHELKYLKIYSAINFKYCTNLVKLECKNSNLKFLKHFPNLKYLTCDSVFVNSLPEEMFNKLEIIELKFYHTNIEHNVNTLQKIHSLKKLVINGPIKSKIHNLKNLEIIEGYINKCKLDKYIILDNLPKLKIFINRCKDRYVKYTCNKYEILYL
uniref:Leucine-rich repeat protein n=1 Tax=Pithovirus LCDPAC02 TaxID=2506601 RepID=A0A481YQW1_9VIRU|nr:MAG: hypothetical protein LCDPAC02_00250 [Pithovirus LCDPAC02]